MAAGVCVCGSNGKFAYAAPVSLLPRIVSWTHAARYPVHFVLRSLHGDWAVKNAMVPLLACRQTGHCRCGVPLLLVITTTAISISGHGDSPVRQLIKVVTGLIGRRVVVLDGVQFFSLGTLPNMMLQNPQQCLYVHTAHEHTILLHTCSWDCLW